MRIFLFILLIAAVIGGVWFVLDRDADVGGGVTDGEAGGYATQLDWFMFGGGGLVWLVLRMGVCRLGWI